MIHRLSLRLRVLLFFAALAGGALVLGAYSPLRALWDASPKPDAKALYDTTIAAATRSAARVNDALHDGSFTRATAIAVATLTAAALYVGETWHKRFAPRPHEFRYRLFQLLVAGA